MVISGLLVNSSEGFFVRGQNGFLYLPLINNLLKVTFIYINYVYSGVFSLCVEFRTLIWLKGFISYFVSVRFYSLKRMITLEFR